ncbi:MAG: type II toxin-antitoxin system VapC family toxin [Planctomycetes bacterium]|nr:type II toxin-antitoxin system VapC family toxin [Planctomycetota bacterium]
MIVLDASVVVELLLRTARSEAVRERLRRGSLAHAPLLLDAEVGAALRRLERCRVLTAAHATEALSAAVQMPISRHPLAVLLPRAWELRKNIAVYDGMYVALAEALSAPLLTTDRRLARVTGLRAAIEVV